MNTTGRVTGALSAHDKKNKKSWFVTVTLIDSKKGKRSGFPSLYEILFINTRWTMFEVLMCVC